MQLRAWHGGRAYFAEFSERAIGSGEGGSLGWGFYFAEHRNGGEYFARYVNSRDGAGFLYEVLLELPEDGILHLDLPYGKIDPHVRSRVSRVFRGREMSFGFHWAYKMLKDELGKEGAARALRDVGIVALVSDEGTASDHGLTYVILEKTFIRLSQVFRFSRDPYAWLSLPIPA